MDSDNIAARLNLPNMAFAPGPKIAVYSSAQEGMVRLEEDIDKRIKYMEYIDYYAKLNETELKHYREEYLLKSPEKEGIIGLRQMFLEEGKIGCQHKTGHGGTLMQRGKPSRVVNSRTALKKRNSFPLYTCPVLCGQPKNRRRGYDAQKADDAPFRNDSGLGPGQTEKG